MHNASATLRGIASDMGAGEVQVLAQELHQQRAGIDISSGRPAVHD
jgi:hypothetical protein